MTYQNHHHLISDLDYAKRLEHLNEDQGVVYREETANIRSANYYHLKFLWREHMARRYEQTREADNAFGQFIRTYQLTFKEMRCLLDLLADYNDQTEFERLIGVRKNRDPFKEHRIHYQKSKLKRHKLVYLVKDPYRPMKASYEVSYKAQLGLEGKPYTDAYEQLDLELEERVKIQTPDELDGLYYVIQPQTAFPDLIIKDETQDKLRAAVARAKHAGKIFKTWGIGNTITYGRGTTLNFRGPPGTGKTMAAECLAAELGKKLLLVRYDQLQSMWLGETEKHIQAVFKVARIKNAVLFFDEADAVANQRADMNQPWQLSQVNTLLKELERYEGVCVFATNFAEKYDPAFERRLTMHIDFDLPTEAQARRILDRLLPQKARAKELILDGLDINALSGGDLKNVILNAAGHAAKDNAKKIRKEDLERAIKDVRAGKADDKVNTKEIGYLG